MPGQLWTDAAEVRRAARRAPAATMAAPPLQEEYHVFLSHTFTDADLVRGVWQLVKDLGFRPYADWIDDPQLDRRAVTKETADLLRSRLKRCRSLLFVVSDQSAVSKWMPWELGYFDGFNGQVGIFLIRETGEEINGQEYLDLYPKYTPDTLRAFLVKSAGPSTPKIATRRDHQGGARTMEELPAMVASDPAQAWIEAANYWSGVWTEYFKKFR